MVHFCQGVHCGSHHGEKSYEDLEVCSTLVCKYLDWLIGSGEDSSGYHSCVNCPRPRRETV